MSTEGSQNGARAGAELSIDAPPSARTVVALSGGVDSSIAASLLQSQGHELLAVTLKMRDCEESGASRSCCGIDGLVRARRAAAQLDIPHFTLDAVQAFSERVLAPAWDAYAAGLTPSPCLPCNERIKLGLLFDWAKKMGARRIATGHYARVSMDAKARPMLLRGVDRDKDQSYFLAGLSLEQLSTLVLPLGELSKPEVRRLAEARGLVTAKTRESQDACLLSDEGLCFAEMLRRRFDGVARPGKLLDKSGKVLGEHAGIHLFTVGQRRGLGLSSHLRRWVIALRSEDAAVILSEDEADLYASSLTAEGLNWLAESPVERAQVRVRYRHSGEMAKLSWEADGRLRVDFEQPVRAITRGQAAVFYDGERVLGRGWIC
ncbi:MAG: tRNA 2-thiouridine(34) synthase MnmA [Myxococcota bacterium]|jgi:tRNA-specific 2-thiouridylase|nr:tRNA 2-thiouridine(34) synthase MnmA [Myxococcota bacterium]